jgi:hypothetical protein
MEGAMRIKEYLQFLFMLIPTFVLVAAAALTIIAM